MLGRNADAVIGDRDLTEAVGHHDRHQDRLTGRGVLHRVRDQVVEELRESRLADRDAHGLGRCVKVDLRPAHARSRDSIARRAHGVDGRLATRGRLLGAQ